MDMCHCPCICSVDAQMALHLSVCLEVQLVPRSLVEL